MSSQLTSPPDHRDTEDTVKPKIDLSASQVLGGALAAMTAAALGSRIGVAGTVIGAAVASVIAAVGGSVYTASIRASRERVKTVLVRRPPGRNDAGAPPVQDGETLAAEPSRASTKRAWSWKTAAIGALAAFALAAVAVTGFELVSGQALSGGSGTTVTQVREDRPGGGTGRTTDDATPEPSSAPSDQPSASDSPTPTAEPSADPSGSTAPTPSSPATSEPTPSADETPTTPAPSASADPSGAANAPADPG